MIPIAITFTLVLAIVAGAYWAFVVRVEAADRRQIEKRMRPPDPTRKTKLLLPKSERSDGASLLGGLQRTIDQSGLKLTVPALIFICWMAALVVGIGVYTVRPWLSAAAIAGGVAALLPALYVRHKATSRMWKFEEQFPEAIDLIARALRAGHAFPTGLQMVADEIGAPVGPEFKLLYDRQNYGMPLADALRAFARRIPVLDAKFFVTAVLTQRETGGNLSGVLDNLSSVIRERFKVKRQVRVVSADGRMTAAILTALPPFVALAQGYIAPENFRTLITEPMGVKMIALAVTLQLIGMYVISRIVKVEY
jgi:tight adherence protein B